MGTALWSRSVDPCSRREHAANVITNTSGTGSSPLARETLIGDGARIVHVRFIPWVPTAAPPGESL